MENHQQIQQQAHKTMQRIVYGLFLADRMQKLKGELETLDNRCAFLAGVFSEEHPEYKKVQAAREHTCAKIDQLIQGWMKEREYLPAPCA